MTDDELQALFAEVQGRVAVACDEYHAHSAIQGCIHGDPRDVIICQLVEIIRRERAIVRQAAAKIGQRP